MASPTLKLSSGYDMPQVGYGLWKVENEKCADLVYNAIKEGYRCVSFRLIGVPCPDVG